MDTSTSTPREQNDLPEASPSKSKISAHEDNFIDLAEHRATALNARKRRINDLPAALKGKISEEKWEKLKIVDKWKLHGACKVGQAISVATAIKMLSSDKRSKISCDQSAPELYTKDDNGVLQKVDISADEVADTLIDTGRIMTDLPDWTVPKDLLTRSYLRFRNELDSRTEDRLKKISCSLRDRFAEDDKAESDLNEDSNTVILPPLPVTEVEWDDWKKEKRIPLVRAIHPSHPSVKGKKRQEGKGYGKCWEHQVTAEELQELRASEKTNDKFLLYLYGGSELVGNKYYLTPKNKMVRLAKVAVENLKQKREPLTESAIRSKISHFDRRLTDVKKELEEKRRKKLQASPDGQTTTTPRTLPPRAGKTPDPAKKTAAKDPEPSPALSLDIPEKIKSAGDPSPISDTSPSTTTVSPSTVSPSDPTPSPSTSSSPSKRVLPARTRRPTMKEAERREDLERARRKCSKDREVAAAAAPAVSQPAAPVPAATPEKTPKPSVKIEITKPVEEVKPIPAIPSEKKDRVKKSKGRKVIHPLRKAVSSSAPILIGSSEDGKRIEFVYKETGYSISFTSSSSTENNAQTEDMEIDREEEQEEIFDSSSEVDEEVDEEAVEEEEEDRLLSMQPSDVIMYRDDQGEIRLLPRCCIADCVRGEWQACRRPGRFDTMSEKLAKRAYEMDINVAWRNESPNQRLCQLHSRLLRYGGQGGSIEEEIMGFMGRKERSSLEKEVFEREQTNPIDELEDADTKWTKNAKSSSAQIFMEKLREVNAPLRRLMRQLEGEGEQTVDCRNKVPRTAFKGPGEKKMNRYKLAMSHLSFIIDNDILTEEDLAPLSAKERRILIEMVQDAKECIEWNEREHVWNKDYLEKVKKRLEEEKEEEEEEEEERQRERDRIPSSESYRPLSPISFEETAVDGDREQAEKTWGPLIRCMAPAPARKTSESESEDSEISDIEDADGAEGPEDSAGESFDSGASDKEEEELEERRAEVKIEAERRQMRELYENVIGVDKSAQEKRKRPHKNREETSEDLVMFKPSERFNFPHVLREEGKLTTAELYRVVGIVRDDEAEQMSSLLQLPDRPVLYLAYNKKDPTKKLVNLMVPIALDDDEKDSNDEDCRRTRLLSMRMMLGTRDDGDSDSDEQLHDDNAAGDSDAMSTASDDNSSPDLENQEDAHIRVPYRINPIGHSFRAGEDAPVNNPMVLKTGDEEEREEEEEEEEEVEEAVEEVDEVMEEDLEEALDPVLRQQLFNADVSLSMHKAVKYLEKREGENKGEEPKEKTNRPSEDDEIALAWTRRQYRASLYARDNIVLMDHFGAMYIGIDHGRVMGNRLRDSGEDSDESYSSSDSEGSLNLSTCEKKTPEEIEEERIWEREVAQYFANFGRLPPFIPPKLLRYKGEEWLEKLQRNTKVEHALRLELTRQRVQDELAREEQEEREGGEGKKRRKRRKIRAPPRGRALPVIPPNTAPFAILHPAMLHQMALMRDLMKPKSGEAHQQIPRPAEPSTKKSNVIEEAREVGGVMEDDAEIQDSRPRPISGSVLSEQKDLEENMKKAPLSDSDLAQIDVDALNYVQLKEVIAQVTAAQERLGVLPSKSSTNIEKPAEKEKQKPAPQSQELSSLFAWATTDVTSEEVETILAERGKDKNAKEEDVQSAILHIRKMKQSVYKKLRTSNTKIGSAIRRFQENKSSYEIEAKPSTLKRAQMGSYEDSDEMGEGKEERVEKKKRRKIEKEKERKEKKNEDAKNIEIIDLTLDENGEEEKKKKEEEERRKKEEEEKKEKEQEEENDSDSSGHSTASIEDRKRYRRQKRAAEKRRELWRKEELEKRKIALMRNKLDLFNKRTADRDKTGLSLLAEQSLTRFSDVLGMYAGDLSKEATLYGVQRHFGKMRGSAAAFPHFIHAVKTGSNTLEDEDALDQLEQFFEDAAAQQEEMGDQPAEQMEGPGTRYRVAENQRRQLEEEQKQKLKAKKSKKSKKKHEEVEEEDELM